MRLRPGLPRTPLGSLQRSPDPLAGFKGAASQRGGESRGKRKVGERKGNGEEGREREGEVDSDAQLEEGRRLAKAGDAGPVNSDMRLLKRRA